MNQKTIEVNSQDMLVACPNKDMASWSSHPKVYLDLSKSGEACCPYCSTKYVIAAK